MSGRRRSLARPTLRRHRDPRRAAPQRLRPPRRGRPRLPRLHRRRPLRRLAAERAPRAAASGRLRQSALGQPDLGGDDRAGRAGPRGRPRASSAPRPTSTSRSSPRTRPARCGSSARPTRSGAGDRFLLSFDNHNSVNGIREFARARGAETTYVPSEPPELRVDEQLLPRYLTEVVGRAPQPVRLPGPVELLRRPAPARLDRAGARARLGRAARRRRLRRRPTGSTSRRWHPDFVALSFYKMFGWPTGVGAPDRPPRGARQARAALVLRRHDRRRLRPARVVPVRARRRPLRGRHRQLPQPARRRDRPAPSSTGSASRRSTRASRRSARWLLDALGSLRHSDGSPAATIYGPRDFERRGATIAFNFLHPDGRVVDERYVDRVARAAQHLAAHRLLLQPRRRRGRLHDLPRDPASAASSATG